VRLTADDHPEWKDDPLFTPVLNSKPGGPDETAALAKIGKKGLVKLIAASHAGMTTDEFDASVRDWFATARHPRFDRPYSELTFQPMLELLTLLRANDYKTFIVSGGGIDFLRVFAEDAYGIPPEQVVGSSGKVQYEEGPDGPVLTKQPAINFIDDGPGKPVGIHQHIGRRPVAAFGNSDGDLQMLRWTDAGDGPRFCLIVHHTDADREWAYDRDSHVGRLDQALTDAADRDWTVVDMKRDWNRIYPPEASE